MAVQPVSLLKQTFAEWSKDRAARLAAAMAFYTMMALAPLLVVAVTVLSAIYGGAAAGKLQAQIEGFVGPHAASSIAMLLQANSDKGHKGILPAIISFVIAIVSASGLFVSLQDAMNTVWNVQPKPDAGWRAMLHSRLISWAIMAGAGLLLFASLVASTVLSIVTHHLGGLAATLSFIGDVVVSFAVVTAMFALVFKYLPDAKIDWKDVMIGAAATAVLFLVGKYLLTLYFRFAAVGSGYGAAGSLAALLIWVYYSSMIFFFGAEFTQVYMIGRGKAIEPDEYAIKISPEQQAAEGRPSESQLRAAAAAQKKGGRVVAGGRRRAGTGAAARRGGAARSSAASASSRGGALLAALAHQRKEDGPMTSKDYAYAAGGLVIGAIAGAVGVEYLLHDPKKPTRKQLAAVRLNERMRHVEHRLGHVARIRDYLDDMDVKNRIDRVEKEIRRAGTHVRAKETGRPAWLVRLADVIGGRWSNL